MCISGEMQGQKVFLDAVYFTYKAKINSVFEIFLQPTWSLLDTTTFGNFFILRKIRWFWLLRQIALFCRYLEHCVAIKRRFTNGLSTSLKWTKIRTPEICFNGTKFLPIFFTQVLWCERTKKWGVRGVEKQTVAEIANMWNQGNWGRSESRSTILTILKSAHSSIKFVSKLFHEI